MKHIAKRRIKNTAQMLAVLGLVGMSTFGMNAYAQDNQERQSTTATHDTRSNHKQMIDQALTNADYTAFKKAIASKPKPTDAPEITEAVFAKMVEAHKLKLAGDTIGAKKIMDELGFKKPAGMKNHFGKMHHKMDMSNFTDAQKNAFKEAHTLRKAGKSEEAKAVLDKAGITIPVRNGLTQKTI